MKLTNDKYKERIEQQEWLILQISLHIEKLMEEQKVTRTELAKRLGTTKGYITQLLDGFNMSLRKVADVMLALDSSLSVDTRSSGFVTNIEPINVEDFTEVVDFTGYPKIFIKEPVTKATTKENKMWAKTG